MRGYEGIKMKAILLINGKKRSGKDYFSDILVEKDEYVKLAFAKTLKDAACSVAGINFDTMEDLKNNGGKFEIDKDIYFDNFKKALTQTLCDIHEDVPFEDNQLNYLSNLINACDYLLLNHELKDNILTFDARIFLQEIGGTWKDIFSNVNIWTELLIKKINSIDSENIIISDYRYPYERDVIQEYFKDRVVKTVKVLGTNLYDTDKYDTHSSETALLDSKFDYHINNTFWDNASIYWQAIGLTKIINKLKEEG